MAATTSQITDSLACQGTGGQSIAEAEGSGPAQDLAGRLAGLVHDLDRLHQKMGGHAAPPASARSSTLIDRIDACFSLLNQMDATARVLCQRLAQAESLNYEQSLQLQARANESQTDALTGLANRRFFDREFSARCVAAQHSRCPLVLLLLDAVTAILAASSVPVESVLMPRTSRANWCDGTMLFWYVRQRIAELKRGGDPFCLLALDVDNGPQIAQSHGVVALHYMMRAQMLHLKASLRDMDVVARMCHSRVIVVLPRTTLASLPPILVRLRETVDRFAYPAASGLLEYSISIGG
ncbi:MAG TPA: diguanylate cyclase, partial [Anaerolineae bacterium]|nr:diguanylate cyclase [Anaerolineae bacterium]